ncbi:MAG: hypothetical protein NC923_02700 [Candidatus Omnitrophica bacterium]|nr:hypothetical protein [Candidatus Omnitrophota bacterium]
MKHRYSVDSDNRLVIKPYGKEKPIKPKGAFGVDGCNRLFYRLQESPAWRRQYNLAPKIIFNGSWKLDSNYDLLLELEENKSQYAGDTLTIKGDIISIERDIFSFECKSYDENGLLHIQIIKLNVVLFSDAYNRICVEVKKAKPDILTLQGAWQLNKEQQIIYTYEKTGLKRKDKISHTLIFQGRWQFSAADKLTYILKHSSLSRFDFRVQLETPNIYPQKSVIKYRVGIGIREERLKKKIICLYGTWKFSRNLGLVFQMDYGRYGWEDVLFCADFVFAKDRISFELKNKIGTPLGITLTFTHRLLYKLDAQILLRLEARRNEMGVETGFKIPF